MSGKFASLQVKVIPGSKNSEIIGFQVDGHLKIKIHSKPIGGKANKELINLLSAKLSIPQSKFDFITGAKFRKKKLRISGIDQAEFDARINNLISMSHK